MADEKRVRDVMTTRVATVRPDLTLGAIADVFERHPFHHLPVVSPETGKVLGIISDRDLLRECLAGKFAADRPASAIMTALVANIDADATLREAGLRILKLGVNSLLVQDDAGRLRGIVTSRDFVKAASAPAPPAASAAGS